MRRVCPVVALLIGSILAPPPLSAQTYLLVVSGIGGEPRYSQAFLEWSTSLVDAARNRFGVADSNVVFLADTRQGGPHVSGRSTKDRVQRAIEELADRAPPEARVFIVLIGHGSAAGGESRFNLPGPDMTAEDFAQLLRRLATQQIVFANLSSASGDFIPVLSAERRTVITATKSGFERNETMFPLYFVEAFATDGADVDKDNRISVLEAFNYARREVARAYDRENRLLTEHALLDDNGDGKGSTDPDPETGDGAVALRTFLEDSKAGAAVLAGTADSVLEALYRRRRELEQALASLRVRKERIDAVAYQQDLERLLLEMARVGRAIREREREESW